MVWLFLESSHSESSSPWARASGDRVGGCVCLQASWCQEPLRSGKGWAMPSPGRTSLWSLGPLGGCSLPGLCCITAQVSSQLCAQVMFVLATFQPRVYGGQGGRGAGCPGLVSTSACHWTFLSIRPTCGPRSPSPARVEAVQQGQGGPK